MGVATWRSHADRCRRRRRGSSAGGFTLIELLIVLGILPVVIGGIAVALIQGFQSNGSITTRLADSHDSQITSAYFVRDVQAASLISTSPTSPVCPSSTTTSQLLGLRWSSGGTNVSVTYALSTDSTSPYLVRNYCAGTAAPITTIVADRAFTGLSSPTVSNSCGGATACATSGGHTGASITVHCDDGTTTCTNPGLLATYPSSGSPGIANVVVTITEYPSEFQYSLTAAPRNQAAQILLPPGGAGPPLVLLGSSQPDLSCANKAGVTVNGGVAVDSSQNGSLSFGPHASLTAAEVYTEPPAGAPVTPSSAYTGPVVQGPSFPDPFQGLPDPTSSTVYPATQTSVAGPGEYLGAVSVTGPVNLTPGIYIFEAGMSVSGGGGLSGSGVMFFIGIPNAPADQVQTASYSVSGNGSINLTAPTSGTYQGISVFQSRSDATPMSISGNGASNTYGGVIYAPDASVNSNGNGGVATGSIVAGSLGCTGNGAISIGFAVISSAPQSTSISLGGTNADVVSVVGVPNLGPPQGTITFYVCNPTIAVGSCTTTNGTQLGTPVTLTTVTGTDASVATSQSSTYSTAGTWCFVAAYTPGTPKNYGASSDTTTDGCFTVDGPSVAITFPTATTYKASGGSSWASQDTCTGKTGMCGTMSDVGGSITTVQYSFQKGTSASTCWSGTAFTATCPSLQTLPSADFTQTAWNIPWNTANFAATTTSYTITVTVTDSHGSQTTTWVTFTNQ